MDACFLQLSRMSSVTTAQTLNSSSIAVETQLVKSDICSIVGLAAWALKQPALVKPTTTAVATVKNLGITSAPKG